MPYYYTSILYNIFQLLFALISIYFLNLLVFMSYLSVHLWRKRKTIYLNITQPIHKLKNKKDEHT